MNFVLALLAGDPLNPNPSASPDPANTFYSPGIIGFLGTFILVIGAILIVFDMVRRIRRVNYRAQIKERLAAEQAEYEGKQAGSGQPGSGQSGSAAKPARKRPAPPARPKRED
ncbi:MAG: hypothetical protein RJA35_1049 [Actinomycetota bacterium]|jgi:hypothetical protein